MVRVGVVSYTFAAASTEDLTFETNKRQTTAEAFVCSPNEAAAGGSAVYGGSQQYLSTSFEISRRTTPTAAPPAAAAAARAPCSAAATQIIPLFVVVQRNHLPVSPTAWRPSGHDTKLYCEPY